MKCGEIWWADFPFKEDATNRKKRPVVVIGWTPRGSDEDTVVLVVPISSFGGDGSGAKKGDVEIIDPSARGLKDHSWVRARRLWSTDPQTFKGQTKAHASLTEKEIDAVLKNVAYVFKPFK